MHTIRFVAGSGVGFAAGHRALIAVFAALVPVLLLGAIPGSIGITAGQDGVPLYINYQGYLTDTLGNEITATLPMTFRVYPDSSSSSHLYTNSQSVSVARGVFSVKLPLVASDTQLFIPGQRRWLGLTVSGHQLQPRTEMTSMAFSFRTLYADNSDRLDGRHAGEFIWNGTSMQGSSNFYISGVGRAGQQFWATASGLSGSPAIIGSVTGDNVGVWGSAAQGIGVLATSDDGHALMAQADEADEFAAWGANAHASGTGVAGSGSNATLYYLVSGTGGAFSSRHVGLFAYATDTTGTGIATMGNHVSDTVYTLADGSGGSFNGTKFGVYGVARNLSGDRCGGYFRTWSQAPAYDSIWTYIGYNYGGTKYNVLGNGINAEVFETRDGGRLVFAPVTTSPYVEDFGAARLSAGECRVDLDPAFLECCDVTDASPLMVFVTLNDDCRGVFVRTDGFGFDVRELSGGKSASSFSYRVVGSRRGCGTLRLPKAPDAPANRATAIGSGALPERPVR
jgi:hypothetical protein